MASELRALRHGECERPLRVAHVALSFQLGGAEKLLVEFAKHADRERFEPLFVAMAEDGMVGDQLRDVGADVTVLNGRHGLRPEIVYQLGRYFRRRQVDLVHTHLDRPHIYGTLAARLAGVRRVVHTRHGQADNLSPRQHRLVRAMARWTDRFVCVSDDAARLTAESHGISPRRIVTIHNGIDLASFPQTPYQVDGPVVNVARLTPEKDWETWIRAASIVCRQDAAARFEIAGDGVLRSQLERLASELGLTSQLRFLGAVNDVPSFLRRASLFAISSRTEGISLALLEAQAQRLPVIATAVGGNVEIIRHGQNGLLVPAENPTALADAILALRQDPARACHLAVEGRIQVEREFDVIQMVGRYEDLYDQVCLRQAVVGAS